MKKIISSLVLVSSMFAAANVGHNVSSFYISSSKGGLAKGGSFSSQAFNGKVSVIMYVDPDAGSEGESLNDAVDTVLKSLPQSRVQKYMIINLDDTWLPNSIIQSKLKSKQKEFPQYTFVTDEDSITLKAWGLKHDAYNCIILDSKQKVLYKGTGPFNRSTIAYIERLIKNETKSSL